MSLSAAGAEVSRPSHDPDRLLAGYRAARTQETLFDLRAGGADFRVYALQTPTQVIQVAQDMAARRGMDVEDVDGHHLRFSGDGAGENRSP